MDKSESEMVEMLGELWRRRLEYVWKLTELEGPLDIDWIDKQIEESGK